MNAGQLKYRMCIGRCEICGLCIGTSSDRPFPFHRNANGQRIRSDHKPVLRSVWRVVGTLGPREDGRRYYIFEAVHNYLTERDEGKRGVDFTRCYRWDADFWYPTPVYLEMSQVRPMFQYGMRVREILPGSGGKATER